MHGLVCGDYEVAAWMMDETIGLYPYGRLQLYGVDKKLSYNKKLELPYLRQPRFRGRVISSTTHGIERLSDIGILLNQVPSELLSALPNRHDFKL